MTNAIRVHQTGGPEVLQWETVAVPAPGPEEIQIRHDAVGLNFIDVYHRTGLYPIETSPFTPGLEAAGHVVAIGAEVEGFNMGDRVAYAGGPVGAYAEVRNIPAHRLVPLPDAIDSETAAAIMLKGMTAEYLLCRIFPVQAGQTILVHAAAGGVGQILCQWASDLGAQVIGTVGSDEKAAQVRDLGCAHPIVYSRENVVERVRKITSGKGVPVVYDGVGQATFEASLDCLARFGMLVSFGQSSGKIPPFDTGVLAAKGSLFLTRPTLMHYADAREDLLASATRLFDVVGRGAVQVHVNQRYPLAEAKQAHKDLEARRTTGSSLLLPG